MNVTTANLLSRYEHPMPGTTSVNIGLAFVTITLLLLFTAWEVFSIIQVLQMRVVLVAHYLQWKPFDNCTGTINIKYMQYVLQHFLTNHFHSSIPFALLVKFCN